MKGIICYYSGSGNTKLICESIKSQISGIEFDLCDIVKDGKPDFTRYDVVGFATFTDFLGAPHLMYSFFEEVAKQSGRYAFVLNTYGFVSGVTLKVLAKLAESRGFSVISGHSLHTPENYPPMRKRNKAFDHAPVPKEHAKFNDFIVQLKNQIGAIQAGAAPEIALVRIGLLNSILPRMSRTQAKKDFGIQQVDEEKCTACGICKRVCPYGAIELGPKPVFDHKRCSGCWACYNHCPTQAIFTPKFKGEFQYAKPVAELKSKFS